MIDVCEACIEISKLKPDPWRKKRQWAVACGACGAWWILSSLKSIRFYYNRYAQEWRQDDCGWGHYQYVPLECTQRRCKGHARHKDKRAKRKYKCDRHAGVCIIA